MMRDEIVAAFTHYLTDAQLDAFIIIGDTAQRFVQFARDEAGLYLDLPSQPLSAQQVLRAEAVLVREMGATRQELDALNVAFRLGVTADANALADLTLLVFRRVYGAEPALPLEITIDR